MLTVWQDTAVISYAEALDLLLTRIAVLPARTVGLAGASGAVTASAIAARLSVPGFANAAMDGYALHAEASRAASAAAPVELAVSGLIAAGTPAPRVQAQEVWEILTGAPVPDGLDAVVPLERVTRRDGRDGTGPRILISEPLRSGQNIRQAGEDFARGEIVVTRGTRLGPHHVMGLAACGVDELPVVRAPRVAVLTTGNELRAQGTDLAPGQIRDANGPYLRSLLPQLGAELTTVTTATDSAAHLREQLEALATGADLVLTTGGVSAGRLDLLPAVVRELGGEVLLHKVAIRPGKPLLHARLPGGVLLFGLPGNPLAVAVCMRFFVIPALRALQGLAAEVPLPAFTTDAVRRRGALRFFAKAVLATDATGQRRVRILPGQESFRIAPLLSANCWAIVPEGDGDIPAGGLLETLPLYPDL
ncbi:MAG: molybdopterin molybdenumtransferase MoeA [Gammaproteobacteria bacterium]|nr:molybdopterin molybdenumtransferase MoeA [Gammaproteobacteria bacterium]